jgi:hypothetical protein
MRPPYLICVAIPEELGELDLGPGDEVLVTGIGVRAGATLAHWLAGRESYRLRILNVGTAASASFALYTLISAASTEAGATIPGLAESQTPRSIKCDWMIGIWRGPIRTVMEFSMPEGAEVIDMEAHWLHDAAKRFGSIAEFGALKIISDAGCLADWRAVLPECRLRLTAAVQEELLRID